MVPFEHIKAPFPSGPNRASHLFQSPNCCSDVFESLPSSVTLFILLLPSSHKHTLAHIQYLLHTCLFCFLTRLQLQYTTGSCAAESKNLHLPWIQNGTNKTECFIYFMYKLILSCNTAQQFFIQYLENNTKLFYTTICCLWLQISSYPYLGNRRYKHLHLCLHLADALINNSDSWSVTRLSYSVFPEMNKIIKVKSNSLSC